MHEARLRSAHLLIVDDEPANVRLMEKLLHKAGYERLTSTTESREAATLVEQHDPDLILLDLRMPHPDGFEVLRQLEAHLRKTYLPVLVLTADLTSAARERALSSGAKDFLSKPLDTTEVLLRIRNLLETRFLYLEERVLLEETLTGSIQALTDVLSLVNPAGFTRAVRARERVRQIVAHLGAGSCWELEVAAMLSQIGSVTLPADTVDKLYEGKQLSHAESAAVARMPAIASRLIGKIPRMEAVASILAQQDRRFDGKGAPSGSPAEREIPWGARVLKLVLDLDALESRGVSTHSALEVLRTRAGWYDPDLLDVFSEVHEALIQRQEVVELEVRDLRAGMVLAEDIRSKTGLLLLARGQQVSERTQERFRSAAGLLPPRHRVHVIVRAEGGHAASVG